FQLPDQLDFEASFQKILLGKDLLTQVTVIEVWTTCSLPSLCVGSPVAVPGRKPCRGLTCSSRCPPSASRGSCCSAKCSPYTGGALGGAAVPPQRRRTKEKGTEEVESRACCSVVGGAHLQRGHWALGGDTGLVSWSQWGRVSTGRTPLRCLSALCVTLLLTVLVLQSRILAAARLRLETIPCTGPSNIIS
ncbi:hypothetical protein Z043_109196, partial [Scleropages formosus]